MNREQLGPSTNVWNFREICSKLRPLGGVQFFRQNRGLRINGAKILYSLRGNVAHCNCGQTCKVSEKSNLRKRVLKLLKRTVGVFTRRPLANSLTKFFASVSNAPERLMGGTFVRNFETIGQKLRSLEGCKEKHKTGSGSKTGR